MRPLIEHARTRHTPETLAEQLRSLPGLMLLRSDGEAADQARYSFVVAQPFLTFRAWGAAVNYARITIAGFNLATRGTHLSNCSSGMN